MISTPAGQAQSVVFLDDTEIKSIIYESKESAMVDMPNQLLIHNGDKVVMNYKAPDESYLYCAKLEIRITPRIKSITQMAQEIGNWGWDYLTGKSN